MDALVSKKVRREKVLRKWKGNGTRTGFIPGGGKGTCLECFCVWWITQGPSSQGRWNRRKERKKGVETAEENFLSRGG